MIFCLFSIRSWIRNHCDVSLPMRSHVYFGRTFAYDPRSRIPWSISYSPICAVNLISLPVLVACFPIFRTTCNSPGAILTHLLMSSCNPFSKFLLLKLLIDQCQTLDPWLECTPSTSQFLPPLCTLFLGTSFCQHFISRHFILLPTIVRSCCTCSRRDTFYDTLSLWWSLPSLHQPMNLYDCNGRVVIIA